MIHMRLAAQDAITFVKGRNRTDLDAEPMSRRAMLNSIQEIGEAAANVTHESRLKTDSLPWNKWLV